MEETDQFVVGEVYDGETGELKSSTKSDKSHGTTNRSQIVTGEIYDGITGRRKNRGKYAGTFTVSMDIDLIRQAREMGLRNLSDACESGVQAWVDGNQAGVFKCSKDGCDCQASVKGWAKMKLSCPACQTKNTWDSLKKINVID